MEVNDVPPSEIDEQEKVHNHYNTYQLLLF